MANRYWVGGTGTWDSTALLKWSLTSGGVGGQAVPTSADTVFFDAASGANTVTIGAGTAICATLTMTGFTGTLAFGSNSITVASSGTIYTGDTTFSVTGTPLVLCTYSGATGRTINAGITTETNSISFNISAGNGTISNTSGHTFKNLIFSGTFTGTLSNVNRTIYGNLTLKTGMSVSAGSGITTFAATSGTQTITSAALNLDFPLTFSGTGTYQLQDTLNCGTATSRVITLTSGTLDLNNNAIINVGSFVSSTTNTRAILFGSTGRYENTNTLTSTVWSMAVADNFTYTGTSSVVVSGNAASGTTRSIQHGSTSGGTEANAISFTVSGGQSGSIFSNTGTTNSSIKNLVFTTGFAGSFSNSSRTIYGNFTCSNTMTLTAGTLATVFAATSGTQQITSAGLNFDFPITLSGTATYQLVDDLSVGTSTSKTINLSSGTLDLNNKTLTNWGLWASNSSNTRSILFGTTGNYTNTYAGTTAQVWGMQTLTGFTYTGTPTINIKGNILTGNTRTIAHGSTAGGSETTAVSFNISDGSDTIAITATSYIKNLIFSGTFTGSVSNTTKNIYGNLTFKTGMTLTAGSSATIFAATSGTQQITSAALNLDFPITFQGTVTYQLQDALTVGATRQITLTSGALDLNNNSLTCGFFSTNTANTRSIAFGTAQIYVNGSNALVYNNSTSTGFTTTGTRIVNCTYSGSTGTRSISSAAATETDQLNFNITAGSDTFNISGARAYKSIDFTGFTGTITITGSGQALLYGNFKAPATGAAVGFTGNTLGINFASTTATAILTSNGYALDFPIQKAGASASTLQLGDDLNMPAIISNGTLTLTNGTLNSNAKNITCALFNYNNANTKTLTLANSTVTITGGTSTSGYTGSGTGTTHNLTNLTLVFTTTGTALANFSGTVPTLTLSGVGGTVIIGNTATATYTLTTLNNTVSPCTVTLGSTITRLVVTNFNLSGTAGNLVTLNSTVAGTQVNIRKTSGTVNAQYMYIQDSLADGGAKWYANSSNDLGNNTGWNIFNNSFLMLF